MFIKELSVEAPQSAEPMQPREDWDKDICCPEHKIKMDFANVRGAIVDVCPICSGVWLDDGEIEPILGTAGLEEIFPKTSITASGAGSTVPKTNQRIYDHVGWQKLAAISVVFAVMGAVGISEYDPSDGIPKYEDLLTVEGKLAWSQGSRYGIEFGLVGIPDNFDYPSVARGMGKVKDALQRAGDKTISVRYGAVAHGPFYSDKRYHTVWALKVDGWQIRSFEEASLGWETNRRLGSWIGLLMLAASVFLGVQSRKAFRKMQPRPSHGQSINKI